MLRQVFILKEEQVMYNKNFGKAVSTEDFNKLYHEIIEEITRGTGIGQNSFDYIKFKIVQIDKTIPQAEPIKTIIAIIIIINCFLLIPPSLVLWFLMIFLFFVELFRVEPVLLFLKNQ